MSTPSKTPWPQLSLIVLLLAACGAAGTWYYVRHIEGTDSFAQAPDGPWLVSIDPLTVNLQNPEREQRLLYVGFSIAAGDADTQQWLRPYVPQIRSQLFKLLGEQDSRLLMTAEGKTALAGKVLALVRHLPANPRPELSILDVFYTDFIVQ